MTGSPVMRIGMQKPVMRLLLTTLAAAALMPVVPSAACIGEIFVANRGTATIGEYTTSGATVNATLVNPVFDGGWLSGPHGIAVSGSDLFVTDELSGTVGEYTTAGVPVNPLLITGLNQPSAITVSGSDLFVADAASGGTIREYTTAGVPVIPF